MGYGGFSGISAVDQAGMQKNPAFLAVIGKDGALSHDSRTWGLGSNGPQNRFKGSDQIGD